MICYLEFGVCLGFRILDLEFLMNGRIEKVNSLLEHEISQILLKDFDFGSALVTLTHVESTANLIEAKAYISVFPEEKSDKVLETLNNGVYEIQQKINKMLNMRPVPKIIFVKDEATANAARVEEILEKLKKEEK